MKIMNYKHIYAVLFSMMVLCSCSDFLEVPPRGFISDDELWKTKETADLFLNDIYNQLPELHSSTEQHLDQFTDNSDIGVLRHQGYRYIGQGQITPDSYTDGLGLWKWEDRYKHIRKCNLFIKKVQESSLADDYKTLRLAEARFLRAYFYHFLWMAYGGVPQITLPLSNQVEGSQIEYPRVTADEMFKFITDELGAIYTDLPSEVSGNDYGRATRGAALTLKGWCELFHASPLRNPAGEKARWEAAAKTNKMVIDLDVYELVDNFTTLFMENNNSESIFARQYGPNKGSSIEGKMGPVKVGNVTASWGNFQPTQDLVDEFSMENGKAIHEPGSGYDPNNPYVGREKRFYQTILYDNSTWHGELITTRVNGNNPINMGYSNDYTHTGYFARKRLDESKEPTAYHDGKTYTNYILFRLAEVLLSYAEAENEVNGPTKDVLDAVDAVRTRSGNMPSVTATYGTVTKEQMREIIHRERRVELSFEDKRWWDIIRLKIAEKMPDGSPGVMNLPLRGMEITENADGTLNYNIREIRNRLFLPKMYYMPIPQTVIDQNSQIAAQNGGPDEWKNGQNPGY